MSTTWIHLAGAVALAQTGGVEPASSGAMIGLAVALVAVSLALLWFVVQLKAMRRQLQTLAVEHQSTTETHRELIEKERNQAKRLEEKQSQINGLKKDLAAQRKKNHATSEALKQSRLELREQTEQLNRRTTERPAFSDAPDQAVATKAKRPETPPAPEPALPSRPAPEVSAPPAVNPELERKAKHLEAELRAKSEAHEQDRVALREARAELKRLRKRVENFRRVDLISNGRIELLEDKVHALGRQYYDAISELAALKGEVQPPRPQELRPLKPLGLVKETSEPDGRPDDEADVEDDDGVSFQDSPSREVEASGDVEESDESAASSDVAAPPPDRATESGSLSGVDAAEPAPKSSAETTA